LSSLFLATSYWRGCITGHLRRPHQCMCPNPRLGLQTYPVLLYTVSNKANRWN
jgi:hypothetical protein